MPRPPFLRCAGKQRPVIRVVPVLPGGAALRLATVTGNHAPRGARQATRPPAVDRYRSVVDVYVLLRRPDGMILLLERSGTGYADGQLCPPSGHLETGESVIDCAAREASEEVGVDISPADLAFTHVVHHRNPEGQGRIGFFFTATRWAGEPVNREPHKCAGLYWADPAHPPAHTVPYTAAALSAITQGDPFSVDGWLC
jgi:8-oxo-dGTP diphosphatase